MYVLTVLTFKIFLDDYYRSQIFSLQNKILREHKKGNVAFPRLHLQVTHVLTAFGQIFFFLLGVSNGTINQIDYTMIPNSH